MIPAPTTARANRGHASTEPAAFRTARTKFAAKTAAVANARRGASQASSAERADVTTLRPAATAAVRRTWTRTAALARSTAPVTGRASTPSVASPAVTGTSAEATVVVARAAAARPSRRASTDSVSPMSCADEAAASPGRTAPIALKIAVAAVTRHAPKMGRVVFRTVAAGNAAAMVAVESARPVAAATRPVTMRVNAWRRRAVATAPVRQQRRIATAAPAIAPVARANHAWRSRLGIRVALRSAAERPAVATDVTAAVLLVARTIRPVRTEHAYPGVRRSRCNPTPRFSPRRTRQSSPRFSSRTSVRRTCL